MMVPVSVLIITYNEEANIARALDSVVAWAREVFVVTGNSCLPFFVVTDNS